jgi:hypothetical protein
MVEDTTGSNGAGATPGPEKPAGGGAPKPKTDPAPVAPTSAAARTPSPSPRPASDEPSALRRWITIIIVVAVLIGLGVAAYLLYTNYTGQRLAVERLDKATILVEEADAVVLEVDEIVRTPVEATVGQRAKAASETIPGAQANLDEATSLISLALPDLAEEHVDGAEALRESAEARKEMLEHATPILHATIKAAEAVPLALEGWNLVIEAQELTDQAIKEYNKLDDGSVKKSKSLTSQAQEKAQTAKTSFEQAQAAYPEADFTPFIVYTEGKIAALGLSIKGADALLGDKPEEANKISDQYNDAEKELVVKAKALPASPADPIRITFEAEIGEATQLYNAARERATESDAQLHLTAPEEEEE